ncbi:double-stranded RNA-specific editase B2-like isoform X1 [Syngnathus scovelli]|uniref:double-stranded RNA-specific editase B2-like isoform X1 n=1 Tax=Syngnathus scovelli TaxID=161590 RepID=UPI00210F38C1|nr:double-stranded RNA-specific editase B2-like isoform X1 [Syngnathus scovelli]
MNTYEVSDVGRKSRRKRKRRSRVKVTGGEEAGRIGERVGQPPSMGGPPAASERKRPQTGHVDVNDLRLKGRGPSKKRAKMRAAELTLSSLVQFPHEGSEGIGSAANDFTEDQLDGWQMFDTDDTERKVFPQPGSQSSPKEVVSTRLLGGLGPMGLLGQLRPGLRYFCLTERLPGRPERRFIAAVRVDGRIFEGCGHSQRAAKARAAAAALRSLCDVSLESKVNGLCGDRQQLPQFFAEAIFQLARQKYQQLMDQSPATPNMAAIVMTTGLELSTAEVVSMATGTKCLDWDGGHCDDNALHDCHAEVVCRRALLRFLYAQLETLLIRPVDQTDVGPASIFEPVTGRQRVFRLRDHIGLHMFVTSSPCGDARLNCPYENDTSPSMKPNMLRCGLRTKVVGGQGTLPITARSANPMGASLSPGKPQVSMSCTDKIAKWCAVGLQGALLSHLVEPVYLRSLTVATLSHTGHLQRVLARRLAPNKRHAAPYRRQLPLLACLRRVERRACGNSSRVSVNWSGGDGDTEELSTTSGLRNRCGTPSRLSSCRFFVRWQHLHRRLNKWTSEDRMRTYVAWKEAAGPYQKAVRQFGVAVRDAGLGTWSRKLMPRAPGAEESR